jgi:integrase
MPAQAHGSIYKTKTGFGIRWPEDGVRPCRAGFRTKTEAREWFEQHVAPRLRRGGPSAHITFDAFCDDYLQRWGAEVAPRTVATVKVWLRPARERFGGWTLAELEGAADDVARWRSHARSEDARHKQTRAMRQVLAAAVRWGYINRNPAKDCGPNTAAPREEFEPFTRGELDAILAELADSPRDQAIVIFAAETGLRTSEWPALERRDIDWGPNPAVTVQRRFVRGKATPYPKTERSRRRIPLTPRAREALDMLPARIDTPYLFVNRHGERINYDNWRWRIWQPALQAAGVRQRGAYHLRHTFATEALAGGVSIFALARPMGASAATIDRHYGHRAEDSEAALRALLTARSSKDLPDVETENE